MKLKDKVAIVTGGTRGIGRAYSLRLAKEGARVVVADILEGKETVDAIVQQGGEAIYIQTDVTDERSIQKMVRKTVEKFARIDILINNAAIFATIVKRPFYEISAGEWDAVMAVNLKGPFLCAKAVFPQMKKQGKGKIINVSSGAFYKGLPHPSLRRVERRQRCPDPIPGKGDGRCRHLCKHDRTRLYGDGVFERTSAGSSGGYKGHY
jgi:NAD(P)-dependent dehydrogenase (short-subunit alcohol dehydrogenase family)